MKDLNCAGLFKELRRRRGLIQGEVARKLGVTFVPVNVWDSGRYRPMPFLACQQRRTDGTNVVPASHPATAEEPAVRAAIGEIGP